MPTLLQLTGAVIPDGHRLDGVSLVPALMGGVMPDRKRKIFWAYGSKRSMRHGPWKLLTDLRVGGDPQLFLLTEDLSEQRSLYNTHRLKAKRMLSELQAWHADVLIGATLQPSDP